MLDKFCAISKLRRFKGDVDRKYRPYFVLLTPVKIRVGMGEYLSGIFNYNLGSNLSVVWEIRCLVKSSIMRKI